MKTRDVILTSVVVSWGAVMATLAVVRMLPTPWNQARLNSEIVTIGGGPGEGTITLAAGKALDGMAMMTMSGAAGGGGSGGGGSLTLSVAPKGLPSISLDAADGKGVLILELPINGQPRIRMKDVDTGKTGWSITLDAQGQPVITPE